MLKKVWLFRVPSALGAPIRCAKHTARPLPPEAITGRSLCRGRGGPAKIAGWRYAPEYGAPPDGGCTERRPACAVVAFPLGVPRERATAWLTTPCGCDGGIFMAVGCSNDSSAPARNWQRK